MDIDESGLDLHPEDYLLAVREGWRRERENRLERALKETENAAAGSKNDRRRIRAQEEFDVQGRKDVKRLARWEFWLNFWGRHALPEWSLPVSLGSGAILGGLIIGLGRAWSIEGLLIGWVAVSLAVAPFLGWLVLRAWSSLGGPLSLHEREVRVYVADWFRNIIRSPAPIAFFLSVGLIAATVAPNEAALSILEGYGYGDSFAGERAAWEGPWIFAAPSDAQALAEGRLAPNKARWQIGGFQGMQDGLENLSWHATPGSPWDAAEQTRGLSLQQRQARLQKSLKTPLCEKARVCFPVRAPAEAPPMMAALGIPAPQQNAMLRAVKRAFWLRSTSGEFFVRAGLGCFIWVFLMALLAARHFADFRDNVKINPQLPRWLDAIQWAERKNARKQRDELLAAMRDPPPVASGLAAQGSARPNTEEKERCTAAESETAMMLAPPAPIRRTRRI